MSSDGRNFTLTAEYRSGSNDVLKTIGQPHSTSINNEKKIVENKVEIEKMKDVP